MAVAPGSMVGRLLTKARAASDQQVNAPYNEYTQKAQAALPKMFAPAYGAISQQFAPAFQGARNYLGANPAMANSGVVNRLNRRLMEGAYGQLGQAMTGATAGVQQGGLDLLSQLLQRRVQARYDEQAAKRQKGGIGGTIGGLVGAGLGAFGGPMLGAAGAKVGSKLF